MEIIKIIEDEIKKYLTNEVAEENLTVEFPPKIELGDFTINCFLLTKGTEQKPTDLASKMADALKQSEIFEKVAAAGPYVNITVKSDVLFANLQKTRSVADKNMKTMVEYLSPNTNKPLHLGHLRNGVLGMAVSNILSKNCYDVIKANLVNDRGVHICKSMLAWQKWGNGDTPEKSGIKGDHFVGMWYVKYAQEVQKNPDLETEVLEMLKKWEQNDPEVRKIWEMMNKWVYEGFEKTYENFGFKFDRIYHESETYELGRDIINDGINKGIFYKDEEGFIVCDLPEKFGKDKDGKPKKVTLQRKDGTSLYMTQDLGTAKLKFDEYKLDESIYVVGSEQNHHFAALFSILQKLGFEWSKGLHHLSYGMVYLPEGKMKSREGTVVDADNLLEDMKKLAREEILKRNKDLGENELGARARMIALAAIKFYLLRTNPKNDIYFNPEESISFEGFTGPYCQYSYARASAILEKIPVDGKADFRELGNDEERMIARKILNYYEQIVKASEDYNPSRVAIAIYELAVSFNQFYQKHNVANAKNGLKAARASLVAMVKETLKEGMELIGIDALEKM